MTPSSLHMSSMRTKTVLITGASSGIGLATASALAGAGARVVIAARDTAKATRATHDLAACVEVHHLDLADLASVRAFGAAWDGPLDVLINNAGVSSAQHARSADGIELQLATNHLGHYALTNLLLPRITDRVVTLASLAARNARLDLDDVDFATTPYTQSRAYNRSKLANLLFTAALQSRLVTAGSPVRALAAHPGFVATGMTGAYAEDGGLLARTLVHRLAQTPTDGALPVLLAATADLPGGTLTGPERLAHMRGGAQAIATPKRAADTALAERLWTWSEDVTGIGFGLGRRA